MTVEGVHDPTTVIASEAKQSSFLAVVKKAGLLRRVAPRNDVEM
jgi:hypothetical protein